MIIGKVRKQRNVSVLENVKIGEKSHVVAGAMFL